MLININQIISLIEKGHFNRALDLSLGVLQKNPNEYEFIKVTGLLYLLLEDFFEAIKYYHQAFALNGNDQDILTNLSYAYSQVYDVNNSDLYGNLGLKINPTNQSIYINLAENELKRRNYESAFLIMDKLISSHGGAQECAKNIKNKKILLKYLDACLSCNKSEKEMVNLFNTILNENFIADIFNQWCSYSSTTVEKKFVDRAKEELTLNYENAMLKSTQTIQLYFGLARYYKNNQQLSEKYYVEGNEHASKILRYNPIVEQKKIQKIKEFFSNQEIVNYQSPHNHMGEGLIFIIGLPRSGTTLTESVSSTADNITSAGETLIMPNLSKKYYLPHLNYTLSDNGFEEIGQEYTRIIKSLSNNKKFIIDKLPNNFFNLGFITKALPQAKIIHVSRNKWSNATSLFQQLYLTNIPYSSSFFNIGVHIANYEEIMNFWKKQNFINEKNFLDVEYESLVKNTEEIASKIFAFCGLSGSYSENKRGGFFARTASKNQVTQKIYSSSINKEIFMEFREEFDESLKNQTEYWKRKH